MKFSVLLLVFGNEVPGEVPEEHYNLMPFLPPLGQSFSQAEEMRVIICCKDSKLLLSFANLSPALSALSETWILELLGPIDIRSVDFDNDLLQYDSSDKTPLVVLR